VVSAVKTMVRAGDPAQCETQKYCRPYQEPQDTAIGPVGAKLKFFPIHILLPSWSCSSPHAMPNEPAMAGVTQPKRSGENRGGSLRRPILSRSCCSSSSQQRGFLA